MIDILKVRDCGKWVINSDGWFEWYECNQCNARYGLTMSLDRKDLPDKCHMCGIPMIKED